MLNGLARHVRELEAHPLSTYTTTASVGSAADALRGRRGSSSTSCSAGCCLLHGLVDVESGLRKRREQRERPRRGGGVAPGAGAGHGPKGAARGGVWWLGLRLAKLSQNLYGECDLAGKSHV